MNSVSNVPAGRKLILPPTRVPHTRCPVARRRLAELAAEVDYLRVDRAELIHELATRDDYIWTLERECDALRAAMGLQEVPE
jgi:hypothetical protein